MDSRLVSKVNASDIKKHPDFKVGDTLEVRTIIKEGDKSRIQLFRGIVLVIKGVGASKTFTVRKISNGVGVEKILPLNSPSIKSIKLVKRGKVRRSKLYYMRNRVGKLAMKTGEGSFGSDDIMETIEPEKEESKSEKEPESK